jgi:alpha-tubulin suppressor-like RCC1 family protein
MITEYDAMTTTRHQKALLYRGTTDNPAFWPRAVLDLPYAAAVISQAVGPSGPNNEYLTNLDEFLNLSLPLSGYSAVSGDDHHNVDDDDTKPLACLLNECYRHSLYFLFGAGSNQHNQLLLRGRRRPNTVRRLRPKESFGDGMEVEVMEEEDIHEQAEILLTTRRHDSEENVDNNYKHNDPPIALFAGGGHSGLQTLSGKLYLFGWNDYGQCCSPTNRLRTDKKGQQVMSYENMEPLPGIEIETASLGFAHTLVIERTTKRLLAFGDNRNGQVTGQKLDAKTTSSSSFVSTPTTPVFLIDKQVSKVAAGVYHSAAITADGTRVIVFGGDEDYLSWKPFDDVRLVHVACGRKHTVVIDHKNRIWTRGDNKYGQLGRRTSGNSDPLFQLAELFNDDNDISCRSKITGVCCGWSHSVITVEDIDSREKVYYGCGRNDFGQLGTSDRVHIQTFKKVFNCKQVDSIDCGSESTMVVVDGKIWGCGWNEHGNLGTGTQNDALVLTPATGASLVSPLEYASETKNTVFSIAAGGAHYLATKTIKTAS